MKSSLILYFYTFIVLMNTFGQDVTSGDAKPLIESVFKINITVHLCANKTGTVNADVSSSKITIPGKSVTLKLEGKEIKIYGIFTPYYFNNNLMLFAQTQLVIISNNQVKRTDSASMIPIALGDHILYYPLGQKSGPEKVSGTGNITITAAKPEKTASITQKDNSILPNFGTKDNITNQKDEKGKDKNAVETAAGSAAGDCQIEIELEILPVLNKEN